MDILTAQAEKLYRRKFWNRAACALRFVTFVLAAGKIGSAR
jgi:hypothetical protein